MAEPSSLLLPEGTRLVHIGPHKTGTTAVQLAFHRRRTRLAEQGVHYAGGTVQPYRAVVSLTGRRGRLGAPVTSPEPWRRLVEEIERAGDRRVVLSCESLANADARAIRRLVHDLGPERVHVVRVLRRYDKVLPSQWQQSVAGGRTHTYEDWLQKVFAGDRHPFWRRHGYRELTQRWAKVVGAENVTVVVVDESDQTTLLRTFEQLVGLPPGELRLRRHRANRSLTRSETELLRTVNQQMQQRGWVGEVHLRFIRFAVAPALRASEPEPQDPAIVTPRWALERAARAADRGVRAVQDMGVRVVGDLSTLRSTPDAAAEPTTDPTGSIGAQAGASALASVVDAAVSNPPLRLTPGAGARTRSTRPVHELGTRELLDILGERVRRRVRPLAGPHG